MGEPDVIAGHVSVYLRRRYIGVTEQHLYTPQIGPAHQ